MSRDAFPFRVLVVTVSHRGDDARIAHRQIGALVAAGAQVAYVAPEPAAAGVGVVERVVIRRAVGRRRLGAWSDAHRAVRARRRWADLVLVHDLEAVLPVRSARPSCAVVWDVHEDVAASVVDRTWVPRSARGFVRLMVGGAERLARAGCRLILAEESYTTRFGGWPVVPNTTAVPDSTVPYDPESTPRVVYVGRISKARGASAMLELGRLLHGEVVVELVGPADADVVDDVAAAAADGIIEWRGPLPNDQALAIVDGALVGLCLLDPLPNYVGSMPTKIYEYAAHGVPTIASPLPLARAAIEAAGAGIVVDPADVTAVATAVRGYLHSPERREAEGRLGHQWMRDHHDWRADGPRFVEVLRGWAAGPRPRR